MSGIHDIDRCLAIAGIVSEAICFACFLFRRAFRALPLVMAYLCFLTMSEIIGYSIYIYGATKSYIISYFAISLLDYLFEIAVMWELISRLSEAVSPSRSYEIRRISTWVLSGFSVIAVVTASLASYHGVSIAMDGFLYLDLAMAIFRVLAFTGILIVISVLKISWSNSYAQVIACFYLYYVVAMLSELFHEYVATTSYEFSYYTQIERVRICTWCIVMLLLSLRVLTFGGRRLEPVRP